MLKYICDKCGEDINPTKVIGILHEEPLPGAKEIKNIHLCEKCNKDFQHWLRGYRKEDRA